MYEGGGDLSQVQDREQGINLTIGTRNQKLNNLTDTNAGGMKKWEDLKNNIDVKGAKSFFNIGNPEKITTDVKEKINQVVKHYIGSTGCSLSDFFFQIKTLSIMTKLVDRLFLRFTQIILESKVQIHTGEGYLLLN